MIAIDKKKYKTTKDNHYKTKIAKTQIVLATGLRKNGYHITRLQHKDYGKSKKWNTYTITRDGVIYQHYDEKYHTDFLGVKEGDKKSISVVLENMGNLFKTSDGKYMNWLNEYCPAERVGEYDWTDNSYWEMFDDEQINSLAKLCVMLCEKYNIPKKCFETHHHHKNIVKFRGIVFRSNYIEDSTDINPLFNIERFNYLLVNDSE
jgi:N-acetyl-anhydromuramyl-L-alanine amidase AmpD